MILGNFSAWVLQIAPHFQPHSTSFQYPSLAPSHGPGFALSLRSTKAKSSLASIASLHPVPSQIPPLLKRKAMCYDVWKL